MTVDNGAPRQLAECKPDTWMPLLGPALSTAQASGLCGGSVCIRCRITPPLPLPAERIGRQRWAGEIAAGFFQPEMERAGPIPKETLCAHTFQQLRARRGHQGSGQRAPWGRSAHEGQKTWEETVFCLLGSQFVSLYNGTWEAGCDRCLLT